MEGTDDLYPTRGTRITQSVWPEVRGMSPEVGGNPLHIIVFLIDIGYIRKNIITFLHEVCSIHWIDQGLEL